MGRVTNGDVPGSTPGPCQTSLEILRNGPRVTSPSGHVRGTVPRTWPLRVVHCPVNFAGIPWQNVLALRRKGVDARLVVFNRELRHPEADFSLDRRSGFARQQLAQWRALARLLPRTDVFHFYFGLTLVPKSLQFPILRATGKKSVFHYLGSDIRGKTPAELAYGKRADAQIVGSFDALRWVPEAEMIPPGLDLTPVHSASRRPTASDRSSCTRRRTATKKGTQYVIDACAQLPVDLDIVEGLPHEEARKRYARADIVVDQLNAGWHGVFALEAMALGKPVVVHLKPRGRRAGRARVRREGAARARDEGIARGRAPPARRESRAAPRDRRREPRIRRAGARHRPDRRPPDRPLRSALA